MAASNQKGICRVCRTTADWINSSSWFFTVHTRVGRARHRLSLGPSHWLCHSGRAPPSPVYKASLAGGVNPRLPLMVSVAALETTAGWASLVPQHRFQTAAWGRSLWSQINLKKKKKIQNWADINQFHFLALSKLWGGHIGFGLYWFLFVSIIYKHCEII